MLLLLWYTYCFPIVVFKQEQQHRIYRNHQQHCTLLVYEKVVLNTTPLRSAPKQCCIEVKAITEPQTQKMSSKARKFMKPR